MILAYSLRPIAGSNFTNKFGQSTSYSLFIELFSDSNQWKQHSHQQLRVPIYICHLIYSSRQCQFRLNAFKQVFRNALFSQHATKYLDIQTPNDNPSFHVEYRFGNFFQWIRRADMINVYDLLKCILSQCVTEQVNWKEKIISINS